MGARKSVEPRRSGTVESVFGGLQRDINRLFSDFFTDLETRPFGSWMTGHVVPQMDIAETDKEYEVKTELPGIEEKDVEITLADGLVTVKGEKKDETEEKGKSFHRVERSYGSFQRTISVPANVDESKISADFSRGVLTIHLPKTAAAKKAAKKIAVKAK